MPMTLLVFVRDYRGLSRLALFSCRLLRCPVRTVMRRKGFGKRFIYTIGPSAIVSNDLVGNFRHEYAPQNRPGEVPAKEYLIVAGGTKLEMATGKGYVPGGLSSHPAHLRPAFASGVFD